MRNVLLQLLLYFIPAATIAQSTLSGTVTSDAGVPVSSARVVISSLSKSAKTNSNGAYVIDNVPFGTHKLEIYAPGYAPKQSTLEIRTREAMLNLTLQKQTMSEEVLITSLRASEKTATAYSSFNKERIEDQNYGQDLPFLLNRMPSTVVTSDAGAGVGYTGIRVRGSDPSRVNVTINGIPLNDSESHGVFWVNLPDLASSTQNIQVQRGVGTSTNGAGAFGASINIQTQTLNPNAYAELNNSYGSFDTRKHTLSAGTGLIKDRFAFDIRLSDISSEGWVDRASSNLRSFFASGGYYGNRTFIKANVFAGNEITFQSWFGVPQARFENDQEALVNHYNNNLGSIYRTREDSINLFESDQRYNYYLYDNQVDNYTQSHYQLLFGHEFSEKFNVSGALHYTKGRGFFEEFREEDPFQSYGSVWGALPDSSGTTDLIRRRWLDNDFYGVVYAATYEPNQRLQFSLGGAVNAYDGDHFGEIIWAREALQADIRDQYYFSRSFKTDANVYFKTLFQPVNKLTGYLDLQVRSINYQLGDRTLTGAGTENELQAIEGDFEFLFFNPKLGLTYQINPRNQVYTSFSVGNREPVRRDFIDNPSGEIPEAETLYDLELGYRLGMRNFHLNVNAYFMYYLNQLVLTGELNDVGANIRQNVDESYRAGVELSAEWAVAPWLTWRPNVTLSQNKITEFTEILYNYAPFELVTNTFADTDIAFSPNLIAGSEITFIPVSGLNVTILSKYVGKQFLDNTMQDSRSLDPFFVNDLRVHYDIPVSGLERFRIGVLVNNILDTSFAANGYTFSYLLGEDLITENFLYPQAGRNFLANLTFRF